MSGSRFASLVERPAAGWSDEERLARARDAAYWRALAPAQTVGEPGAPVRPLPPDVRPAALLDDLAVDGYFATPPLLDDDTVARMANAVDAVVREGWPPVFAYVFDAFWDGVGTVDELLGALLGEGCSQSAGMWLNHVRPVDGAAGWPPHIDIPGAGPPQGAGAPERVTVWVPVTDATLATSCIHVVPRAWAETCDVDLARAEHVRTADAMKLLHGARAVPARAGAVLAWAPNVLHWGSPMRRDAPHPRASLSLEYLREDVRPRATETRRDRGARPDFRERLFLIGLGLRLYASDPAREPYASRFLSLSGSLG